MIKEAVIEWWEDFKCPKNSLERKSAEVAILLLIAGFSTFVLGFLTLESVMRSLDLLSERPNPVPTIVNFNKE